MSQQDSLGFIEAAGLTAAIMAADAMAKTADVRIIAAHKVDGLRVCVICEGDVASCKAAVDAGVAIIGDRALLCNVIPRPADGELSIQELLAEIPAKKAARKAERLARKRAAAETPEDTAPLKDAKDRTLPAAASPVLPATSGPAVVEAVPDKTHKKTSEIVKSSAIPMAEAPTTPIPMAEAPTTPIPMAEAPTTPIPMTGAVAEGAAGEQPVADEKPAAKSGDKKTGGEKADKPKKRKK